MDEKYLIGIIAFGVIVALGGGLIGTYLSIKNTESKRERRFVVRSALLFWFASLIFIAFLLLIESPYKYLIWLPWAIFFTLWLRYSNRKQAQIRAEEFEKDKDDKPS